MTVHTLHPSPIGDLLLVGETTEDSVFLTGLYMEEHRRGPAIEPAWTRDDAAFAEVASQLDAYFAGRRRAFDIPLSTTGTPFQLAVWDQLRAIPCGETRTYGELARRIGRPGAARAVGAAVGRGVVAGAAAGGATLGGSSWPFVSNAHPSTLPWPGWDEPAPVAL